MGNGQLTAMVLERKQVNNAEEIETGAVYGSEWPWCLCVSPLVLVMGGLNKEKMTEG